MRLIACLLFFLTISRAASIESLPLPPAFQLVLYPRGEASTSVFSLTCTGFSFIGGAQYIPAAIYPANPPSRADSKFIGANPNCLVRGLGLLSGRQNTPTAENLPRYGRALFQDVWPGIDAEITVIAPRIRLTFSLASPELAATLQIRLPQQEFMGTRYTDIRNWGYDVHATVRAIEHLPNGTRPVPVTVDNSRPAPFLLPAGLANPVDIILEAEFPSSSPVATASLTTPSGERFEAIGDLIRKYSPNGTVEFETFLESAVYSGVSRLTLGPDDALYISGFFGDFYTFLRNRQPGLIAIRRLDSRTGKVIYSRYIGSSWHNAGVIAGFQQSGDLILIARSNSPQFPRIGPMPPNPCLPTLPSGFSNGKFCLYALVLSPAGEILSSRPLPATAKEVVPGRNGIFHVLHPDRIETLDRAWNSLSTIPLPAGLNPQSFVADTSGGLWLSLYSQTVKQLLHFPSGGARPRIIPGINFQADLVPLPEGGVVATSLSWSINPSAALYPPGSMMPAACPQGSPELAVINPAGDIQYGTYLPPAVFPPSVSQPAIWRNGGLIWDRYTLNLEASPAVAIACLTKPAGNYIGDISPGAKLELAVRGVQDESPWQSGEEMPTDVRGWSVRFDGTPAAILGLDQDKVTVIVPNSLANGPLPRSVVMSFWYRGRQEEYSSVRLVAAHSGK